ncbi:MAG: hypothetical protein K2W95_29540 [Candidatus Obscuribacterales bacterium]|nr:hypothetical protein [Candidatus Obscuribacterales bacterium]
MSGNFKAADAILGSVLPHLKRKDIDPLLPARYWRRVSDLRSRENRPAAAAAAYGELLLVTEEKFPVVGSPLARSRSGRIVDFQMLVITAVRFGNRNSLADLLSLCDVLTRVDYTLPQFRPVIQKICSQLFSLIRARTTAKKHTEASMLMSAIGSFCDDEPELLNLWHSWLMSAPVTPATIAAGLEGITSSLHDSLPEIFQQKLLLQAHFLRLGGQHGAAREKVSIALLQPVDRPLKLGPQYILHYSNFICGLAEARLKEKKADSLTEDLLEEACELAEVAQKQDPGNNKAKLALVAYRINLARAYELQSKTAEAERCLDSLTPAMLATARPQLVIFYVFVNGRTALLESASGAHSSASKRIDRMILFTSQNIAKSAARDNLLKTLEAWKSRILNCSIPPL